VQKKQHISTSTFSGHRQPGRKKVQMVPPLDLHVGRKGHVCMATCWPPCTHCYHSLFHGDGVTLTRQPHQAAPTFRNKIVGRPWTSNNTFSCRSTTAMRHTAHWTLPNSQSETISRPQGSFAVEGENTEDAQGFTRMHHPFRRSSLGLRP
jgi:hypothetical protein